jgi:hypothetical protein
MRLSANLPRALWTESAMAAIVLYNMSPSARKGFKSPNEVFQAWFRQYFRYYDPTLTLKLTTDLRPDWSNLYAYGCRAYPMVKDREALRQKRAFKVNPRAHLGYLVGYVSSNIYRIWVPQLQCVIVTRNVTFNETLFYSGSLNMERAVGQPRSTLKDLVEMLEEDEGDQDAGFVIINRLSALDTLELKTPSITPNGEQLSKVMSAIKVDEPMSSGVKSSAPLLIKLIKVNTPLLANLIAFDFI